MTACAFGRSPHTTAPRQIGEAVRDARTTQLLLSHIAPAVDSRRDDALRSIAASYAGPAEIAQDGMRIIVRQHPTSR